MAKKPTLADDVQQRIRECKPGYIPWDGCLPAELQKELADVKRRFRAGQLRASKNALARAVADVVAERGHNRPGRQAVIHWLHRD
jgi:hypothetical protein